MKKTAKKKSPAANVPPAPVVVYDRCWCGCVMKVVDGKDVEVVEFCGVPHRDMRNDPGYPFFVPLPKKKKMTIKKKARR